MVQPVSSTTSVSAMLRTSVGFIIAPTLPLNIVPMIPNNNLRSTNMVTLPLRKATLFNIKLLPAITKGKSQVMKIMMIFNGRVSNDL